MFVCFFFSLFQFCLDYSDLGLVQSSLLLFILSASTRFNDELMMATQNIDSTQLSMTSFDVHPWQVPVSHFALQCMPEGAWPGTSSGRDL